ncbi:MAG: PhzF family phenazine biosynthesis protein, partial [Acidobacteriota bacterium]|nr:PhzF family phenazine biosynthesis protein [Acidobacteriota bacterium]
MGLRIVQVDAFTSRPFGGNPAAVCVLPQAAPEEWMRQVAREMNLSETVFVQKPTDDRALARLRIFTTKQELKLAGHPVIGTWFLLAELG